MKHYIAVLASENSFIRIPMRSDAFISLVEADAKKLAKRLGLEFQYLIEEE